MKRSNVYTYSVGLPVCDLGIHFSDYRGHICLHSQSSV